MRCYAVRPYSVGRHAVCGLMHRPGRQLHFISHGRRLKFRSALIDPATKTVRAALLTALRKRSAGSQSRVRVQLLVTGRSSPHRDHPALSAITPALCLPGVPRGLRPQYSCRMRSLAFHFPGFGSVRAQPGSRADARNGVVSSLGAPSRASQLLRWA
jgi:hypothetical protein